jgi:hypothetical protein
MPHSRTLMHISDQDNRFIGLAMMFALFGSRELAL